jgi:hypothetical protein
MRRRAAAGLLAVALVAAAGVSAQDPILRGN